MKTTILHHFDSFCLPLHRIYSLVCSSIWSPQRISRVSLSNQLLRRAPKFNLSSCSTIYFLPTFYQFLFLISNMANFGQFESSCEVSFRNSCGNLTDKFNFIAAMRERKESELRTAGRTENQDGWLVRWWAWSVPLPTFRFQRSLEYKRAFY